MRSEQRLPVVVQAVAQHRYPTREGFLRSKRDLTQAVETWKGSGLQDIAYLAEIAWRNRRLTASDLERAAARLQQNEYGRYLRDIIRAEG